MASVTQTYCYDGKKSFTLVKWKIRKGSQLFYNSVLLSYTDGDKVSSDGKEPQLKYKSNIGGTVLELIASEGEIVNCGAQLLKIQPCTHPVIMKDLCAECGTDLRHLDRDNFERLTASNTFSMVHVVPELKVSLEQAEQLGQDDEDRLLKSEKLVLLVDLDQTLIHTTNDNVPQDLPNVHHFQLYGAFSPWYHTKLRPGTEEFLERISKYYELHICTFGARLYAHRITKILDPDGKYFSHRILSRDECFDATSKTGNLKALFPRGDHMVCIIDDREDVWNFAPNVVHVKPFCYFRNTGDINSPLLPPAMNPRFHPSFPNVASVEGSPIVASDKDHSPLPAQSESQAESSESPMTQQNDLPAEETKETLEKKVPAEASETKRVDDETGESVPVPQGESKQNSLDTSESGAVTPGSENTTLQRKDGTPQIEEATPQSEEAPPQIKDATPLSEEATPQSERATPQSEEATPQSEKATPQSGAESTSDCASKEQLPQQQHNDDYLLYLEEILVHIHKTYYGQYRELLQEQAGKRRIPDMKEVVPQVRRQVLLGVNIVFSSVIPVNSVPESHQLWTLAESLGARVSRELEFGEETRRTTHVVASKHGTAKVNAARRHKSLHVVSLDWLLCCAERWEHVDERLFPLEKDMNEAGDPNALERLQMKAQTSRQVKHLSKSGGVKRHHHNSSSSSRARRKEKQQQFCESVFIEAGLSLSLEDIKDMDREIDEACSEESRDSSSSSSSSSGSSSSSTSGESLSSGDYPRGWKRRRKGGSPSQEEEARGSGGSSDADTIGSVDEEIAEAVKQEFGSF